MNPGASQALLQPHMAKIRGWGGPWSRGGGNTRRGISARVPKLGCLALGRKLSSFSGQAGTQRRQTKAGGRAQAKGVLSEPPSAAGSARESESSGRVKAEASVTLGLLWIACCFSQFLQFQVLS